MSNSASTSAADSQTPATVAKTPRAVFWLVVIAILLMASNMRSPIVALGSIAPVVQDALGLSAAHIGWLGAIPMLMFALGALVSPAIGKRYGLENTLIAVVIVLTAGIIMRSTWTTWNGFLIGTILLSLAIGFANTLVAPVIKQHTPGNIALVTSMFSLTMSVMAGIVSGLVYPLSEQVGWQWALGGWASLGIAALVAWIILRLKLGSSNKMPLVTLTENEAAQEATSVWKSALAWQLAIFMGLQSLLFYTIAAFLPSIWISKGLSEVEAGSMASIFQFMAPIAIIGMTWLIRKRGVRLQTVAIGATVLNVIGLIGISYLPSLMPVVWTAVMGLGCAAIFTLCIMLFSLRTYTPNQASKLSGMAQTIAYLVAFAGPFGAGWLYELSGNWNGPLLFILILTIINVIIAWLASRPIMIDGKPA
ncbi:MAG TPA: MFS transporter [Psychrobacter sp.]|uniref:Putative transporter YycB n=1 Tax=Psychrobacter pasteurii TaxID=1945520 RepID=A0A1R4ECC9_9GAMM|nr:MFS transporter [Psychrobacter pasteurii]SJM36166.1 putative transporter YycB [Psychrobacter pasteurii]HAO58961.1 MFS transporter [Psychrobacter sp.]